MKVLLIYPPDKHMIKTNVPAVVDEETGHYPPLGLLYVAAYMEKHSDHEVRVLDTQVEELDQTGIAEKVRQFAPDVAGIQTMTFTLIDAIQTARTVKSVDSSIHVCLGGPHVNIYPEETIRIPEVDSLVLSEGEVVFTDLVNALASGTLLDRIQGVVSTNRNGEVCNTGARPLHDDLDALPHPARHLLPQQSYWSVLAERTPITTMMSSRGCPFQCTFCDRPYLGKFFRYRSAESIAEELKECEERGIGEVFFYDDTFTIRRERVLAMTDEIIRQGTNIWWDVRARVDNVDEELLRKMKAAGCSRVHYGVEAGTAEILKTLKKGITVEQIERAFKLTKDLGMTTLGYFMIGSPGETREQVLETVDFAKGLGADYVHVSVLTPFPATQIYFDGLASGQLPHDYWREFAANPTQDFVPLLWEEVLTRDELWELLQFAYRSFYGRPSYLLRQALKVRSLGELWRKARAGVKLLAMPAVS